MTDSVRIFRMRGNTASKKTRSRKVTTSNKYYVSCSACSAFLPMFDELGVWCWYAGANDSDGLEEREPTCLGVADRNFIPDG